MKFTIKGITKEMSDWKKNELNNHIKLAEGRISDIKADPHLAFNETIENWEKRIRLMQDELERRNESTQQPTTRIG